MHNIAKRQILNFNKTLKYYTFSENKRYIVMSCVDVPGIVYLCEFLKAIRRLSESNDRLIEDASDIMDKIFTAGESIQQMEELKKYQEETKKWENLCQIKGKTYNIYKLVVITIFSCS